MQTCYEAYYQGNDAGSGLTLSSYYTGYSANGTAFTSTYTNGTTPPAAPPTNPNYRRASGTNGDMRNFQGMNKGSYTTDMNSVASTSMLSIFNNTATTKNYIAWDYDSTTQEFSLIERLTATLDEIDDYEYQVQIGDNYINTYSYEWYVDGDPDTSVIGDIYQTTAPYGQNKELSVVVGDGTYYTVAKGTITALYIDISFNINTSTHTVTASLGGTAISHIDINDYTFQWYIENISGLGDEAIEGEDSLTLTGLINGNRYKLVATNNEIPEFSAEGSFLYGTRTVIYVSYAANATYQYPARKQCK